MFKLSLHYNTRTQGSQVLETFLAWTGQMQQEDPKDSRRRAASLPVPPDDQPQREGPRPSSPSLSTKAPDTVHKSHTVPVTTASHAIPNSDPSELSTPRWPGKEPVPKLQRRGLFANFAILPEIEDPYQYPRKTKWFIVLLAAYCAAAAPLGSAIFFRRHFICSVGIISRD